MQYRCDGLQNHGKHKNHKSSIPKQKRIKELRENIRKLNPTEFLIEHWWKYNRNCSLSHPYLVYIVNRVVILLKHKIKMNNRNLVRMKLFSIQTRNVILSPTNTPVQTSSNRAFDRTHWDLVLGQKGSDRDTNRIPRISVLISILSFCSNIDWPPLWLRLSEILSKLSSSNGRVRTRFRPQLNANVSSWFLHEFKHDMVYIKNGTTRSLAKPLM